MAKRPDTYAEYQDKLVLYEERKNDGDQIFTDNGSEAL